eukprot:gene16681-11938_t
MIAGPWSHIINDDLTAYEMPSMIASTTAVVPPTTPGSASLPVMGNPNASLANSSLSATPRTIQDEHVDATVPTAVPTITDTAPVAPRIQAPENTTAVPLHQLNVAVLGQDRTFAQPLIDMLLQRPPSSVEATDETILYDTESRRLKEASQRFLLPLNVALSPCWIGTVDGQAKEETWATLQALERLLAARWIHVHGVYLVLHRLDPALFALLASLLSPSLVQVLYVVIPSWRRGGVPSMTERQTMFGKYFVRFGGLADGLLSRMLFFDLRDTRGNAAGLHSAFNGFSTLALLLPTAGSPGATMLPCECVFASSYPQQWWLVYHDALASYGRFPWRFIVFVLLLASLGIQRGRLEEQRIQLHAKDLAIAEKGDKLSKVSSQLSMLQNQCAPPPGPTPTSLWQALTEPISSIPRATPAKTATKPTSAQDYTKRQPPKDAATTAAPSPTKKESEQAPTSPDETTSAAHGTIVETPAASTEANVANEMPPADLTGTSPPIETEPVHVQSPQDEQTPPEDQPQ